MTVSGFVKNSLVDYPGAVSCVLFVPYCNYNCFYCHNRSLIEGNEKTVDTREILSYIHKRAGLVDAVVITGGEPALQPDLREFIREVRSAGCRVKIDTNGSRPHMVSLLLEEGLCDYIAVDYKAPAARYAEICGNGASAAPVLESIGLLLGSKASFEVRTTVIPQLSQEDLLKMARELPVLPRYVLNRYRKPER